MRKRWRSSVKPWGARLAFAAALLALLGTSRPHGWNVAGKIEGPLSAPPAHGIALTIDATSEPVIVGAMSSPSWARGDIACLSRWERGKPMTCVIPPGASLASVELRGPCGGCNDSCPPPPDARLSITTKDVPVWTEHVRSSIAVHLPIHPDKWIGSPFTAIVNGAGFVWIRFDVRPRGGGDSFYAEEQPCRLEPTGPGNRGACRFLVPDDALGTRFDVDISVDATGFGIDCKGLPDATGACDPPGTLVIESFKSSQ